MPQTENFIDLINKAILSDSFIQLSLLNKRNPDSDLKFAVCRLISLKKGRRLNIVYRHNTKDITKNYEPIEGINLIKDLIKTQFNQAILYTTESDIQLSYNKSNDAKVKIKPASKKEASSTHDHKKNRIISTDNNIYLRELGVTTVSGQIKSDKQDKYKQINKYIEIIDGILKQVPAMNDLHVIDMGSGKGYLTFALYDYLLNNKKLNTHIKGIELRQELVDSCNEIAKACSFNHLTFEQNKIEDIKIDQLDMLIALHACDTATDDAIIQGIHNNVPIIICAPCCHKQLRKQINPNSPLNQITRYGILKERQSEILTDTIRSLILEAYGYKTNVFEFIATEHTPKNVIISAVKKSNPSAPNQDKIKEIQNLKSLFGIKEHYLEKVWE